MFSALYGTWEVLDGCEILPQGVGMICPYFWEIFFLSSLFSFPAIPELAARDSEELHPASPDMPQDEAIIASSLATLKQPPKDEYVILVIMGAYFEV